MEIRRFAIAGVTAMALSMLSLSARAGNLVLDGDFSIAPTTTTTLQTNTFNFYGGGIYGESLAPNWFLSPSGAYDISGGSNGYAGSLALQLPFGTEANLGDSSAILAPSGLTSADNFMAIDGSCCTGVSTSSNPTLGPLTQLLTGLTGNTTYVLSFDYGLAQLAGTTTATCGQWIVTIGGTVPSSASPLTLPSCDGGGSTSNGYAVQTPVYQWSTPLLSITSSPQTFSGWFTDSVTFTTGSGVTSELLGFLSVGAPVGGPPMNLLTDISVVAAPEPATYTLIGAGLLGIVAGRRRLRKRA